MPEEIRFQTGLYGDPMSRSHLWKNEANQFHREDGPARITYLQDQEFDSDYWLFREEWLINGLLHREQKPAYIAYTREGILEETWYFKGKEHRIDGPAVNLRDIQPQYRLYGICCSEKEFERLISLPRLEMLIHLSKLARDKDYYAELVEPYDATVAKNILASGNFL